MREDPNDRFVALVTRELLSLVHHHGPVAVGAIVARLVAASAMWEARSGAGSAGATVALPLPLDLQQAVVYPSVSPVLLAALNFVVLVVLILLVRGWVPGRPHVRATRS